MFAGSAPRHRHACNGGPCVFSATNETDIDTNYRQILRCIPALCLVLEADDEFRIVDASDAYLRTVGATRERIVGRPLFDVAPDSHLPLHDDGSATLRASLARVLATGGTDRMAAQRHDVPGRGDGRPEERYFEAENAPVRDSDGRIGYIVHRIEDVTDVVGSMHDPRSDGSSLSVEVSRRGRALAEATDILESITEGFFALDRGWRFTYINRTSECRAWTATRWRGGFAPGWAATPR